MYVKLHSKDLNERIRTEKEEKEKKERGDESDR